MSNVNCYGNLASRYEPWHGTEQQTILHNVYIRGIRFTSL